MLNGIVGKLKQLFKGQNGQENVSEEPVFEKAAEELPAAEPERILPPERACEPIGPITGCQLNEISALTDPGRHLLNGHLLPAADRRAARLSLELAGAAYSLELEPWAAAGWRDFSVLIDNQLTDGLNSGDGSLTHLPDQERLNRARALKENRNILSQLLAAYRQRGGSDTVKAVCAVHPAENGRYMLAIGFMGTGHRFYDWFSNLKAAPEDGCHTGFLQLCTFFESQAESIRFPETAAELGMESLSLKQILEEAKSADSRFHIWMAGHSQGSAVMQLFTMHLTDRLHVPAKNLTGWGFASPTVCMRGMERDPGRYPLHHVLNPDDLIPRVGSVIHLGVCLKAPVSPRIRACYGQVPSDEERTAQRLLLPFFAGMRDTPRTMISISVLLEMLTVEKGEAALNSLMDSKWSPAPVDRILTAAGGVGEGMIRRVDAVCRDTYRALTGHEMRQDDREAVRQMLLPAVRALSVKQIFSGLTCLMRPAHKLFLTDRESAYTCITLHELSRCTPFTWSGHSGRRCAPYFSAGNRRTGARFTRTGIARLKKRA